MTIAWQDFTPWSALAGGALIGLAAALLMLANGEIAGISGILGRLVGGPRAPWRFAFVAGLLVAPELLAAVAPRVPGAIEAGPLRLIAAGLLVGVGTRVGAGCTSGHGVCGLSRGSLRSLVATLAFMAAGFATVFVLRHL
ncbi:MAG: YeeE/YedE family protein [Pelomonas sp.]|nr:YeeE/YedE family protein [Roseateles sp.]